MRASTHCNPDFYLLYLLLLKNSGECYCQNKNIGVDCTKHNLAVALLDCVCSMQIILASASSRVHGARFVVLLRVGLWTFPSPGCLISHVQLCNENESQYPLQPRLLLVVPATPEEFRRMLLPEQEHRCRLYEAQSCGSPPGLRLQHANHPCVRFFTSTWSQIRRVVTRRTTQDILAFSCDDLFFFMQGCCTRSEKLEKFLLVFFTP